MCKICEFKRSLKNHESSPWRTGNYKSRLVFDATKIRSDCCELNWFIMSYTEHCFRPVRSARISFCPCCGEKLPEKDENLLKEAKRNEWWIEEAIDKAIEEGMRSLRMSGSEYVLDVITSFEEVVRKYFDS